MKFVTADWETFFTDQRDNRGRPYSLSSISTEDYVRHPWFEAHGCAIKWSPDIAAQWYIGDRLRWVLKETDWSDVFMIHHHSQFDSFIESHHYDVHPKMLGCTLSMARLMIGNHLSVSLDSVRKHFGIPAKTTPYNLFRGKHWHEMSRDTQEQIAAGAIDEVESIFVIFGLLMQQGFPVEELEVIDLTMRMFTEPMLQADSNLLAQIWEKEAADKQARMAELRITEADLQSSEKFATLLRAEGVEPDTKPGKNKDNYCFAKTDQFMRDLLEDENDRVRTLAEARLGAKSTLMQTRAETLGWMASRGPMPVYLRYCGAHTTRWSGGDGANWQNFRRADPDNPGKASPLRRAIMAPEGYLLAPVDLAQIECRLLNYLAGQEDVIERFRAGVDPYIGIASQAYGFPVTRQHAAERGTGKQLELSCGFMAGAATIQNTARLGIYGPPVSIDIETATRWRDLYRDTHPAVVAYWKTAGRLIARLAGGEPMPWGPMEIRNKGIYGPGGTMLIFDTLEFHRPTEEEIEKLPEFKRKGYWRHRTRNGWVDLYSGKLVENVVQWLARIVMSQAAVRLARRGYRILNTTHDELLFLFKKDGQEEHHLQECQDEMARSPVWLPEIPLAAEGSLGERYSK